MSDTPDVDVTLIPKSRQAMLPTPQPAALIHYSDGKFVGSHPDLGVDSADSLDEIIEKFEYYVFDHSVYALGERIQDILLLPSPSGGAYFHSPKTVERSLAMVFGDYLEAKHRYLEWLDDKTDLAAAWYFAADHPAFWLVEGVFSQPTNPLVTVNQFGHDGETLILVENGPRINREESTDPFVTGEGITFEKAVIEHAELVAERYNWDGEPRPSDSTNEGWGL